MKHTLKNGIIVEDNRDIQCGVFILNAKTKYFDIYYEKYDGEENIFLLRTYERQVDEEDFNTYLNEYKSALKSYRQIKKLLKI